MERILLEAIKLKKPIEYEYNKPNKIRGKRVGNPHAVYNHHTTGNLAFDVWQTSGVSDRGEPMPGWRRHLLAFVENVRILKEQNSFVSADGYNSNSESYSNAVGKI